MKIKNEQPVQLVDFTMALLGVGQQFERFIENEADQHQIESELLSASNSTVEQAISLRVSASIPGCGMAAPTRS